MSSDQSPALKGNKELNGDYINVNMVHQHHENEVATTSTPINCCRGRKACLSCCCSCNNYWKMVVLMFIVMTYLLLGGLFFHLIEEPFEIERIQEAKANRTAARENLKEHIYNFTSYISDRSDLSFHEVENLTKILVKLARVEALTNQTLPEEVTPKWDYSHSVFFASTVITTVGYGQLAPQSDQGRILVIFYAVFGIPIALVLLSIIGSIINDWLDVLIAPLVHKFTRIKNPITAKWVQKLAAAVVILFIAVVFFVLIPALLFCLVESPNNWTYFESIYYCVISLTTVGFGDFVPGIKGSYIRYNTEVIVLYQVVSALWMWFGLAIIATVIANMQELAKALFEYVFQKKLTKQNGYTQYKTVHQRDSALIESQVIDEIN